MLKEKPKRRKEIPGARRVAVLLRDEFKCRHCGIEVDAKSHNIDHVIPVRLGGGDEIENLVTSCLPCNRPGRPKLPPGEAKRHTAFRLSPNTLADLAAIAAARGTSTTAVLEAAIAKEHHAMQTAPLNIFDYKTNEFIRQTTEAETAWYRKNGLAWSPEGVVAGEDMAPDLAGRSVFAGEASAD